MTKKDFKKQLLIANNILFKVQINIIRFKNL